MRCDECEESEARWRCKECGQGLCDKCDNALHLKGKRRLHYRERSPEDSRQAQSSPRNGSVTGETVVLYWDTSGSSVKSLPDVQSVISSLADVSQSPPEVLLYSPHYFLLSPEQLAAGFKVITRPGLSVYESVIMDISLRIRTCRPDVLVLVSAAEGVYKSFLRELSATVEALRVYYACCGGALALKRVDHTTDPVPQRPPELRDSVPLLHYWPNRCFTSLMDGKLKELLVKLANSGRIRVEFNALISALQRSALVKSPQAREIINKYETAGLIHCAVLQFAQGKTVRLVSIRAEKPSIQLILWAVRSLKRDEMAPTERSIQTRLFEAFRYKASPQSWERLLHECSACHKLLQSAMEYGPIDIPRLHQKPGTDPISSLPCRFLYIEGEDWPYTDFPIIATEVAAVKDTAEWTNLLAFLGDYFEDCVGRAAGGVGKFALFLTFFGPESLRCLPLAKVVRLVQVAIADGVLMYENGKLCLRRGQGAAYSILERQSQMRHALLEVLGERPDGVCIEELRGYLREELGLLGTAEELEMDQFREFVEGLKGVKVEVGEKGEMVVKGGSRSSTISTSDSDALLSVRPSSTSEHPYSTPLSHTESTLSQRLSQDVLWRSSEWEDTQDPSRKWSGDTLDLLEYYEPHLKLKAEIEGKRELHGYSRSAGMRRVGICDEVLGLYSTFEGSEDHLETLSEEDSSSPTIEDKPLQSQLLTCSPSDSGDPDSYL